MNIIGVGTDLLKIDRIEKILLKFGDKFCERVFCPEERARAEQHPTLRAARYAKYFALKEACVKALGTGLRNGITWQDILVHHSAYGRPGITLQGHARQHLSNLLPKNTLPKIDVSATDEYPIAQAIVIISYQDYNSLKS